MTLINIVISVKHIYIQLRKANDIFIIIKSSTKILYCKCHTEIVNLLLIFSKIQTYLLYYIIFNSIKERPFTKHFLY